MKLRNQAKRKVLGGFTKVYLDQYWPETPESALGWTDNAVLMLAYQDAGLAVLKHFGGKPMPLLDVSTGPALAPLLALLTCVSEVQLSDYNLDNRLALQEMDVSYWRNYVPMLTKIYDEPYNHVDEILGYLDRKKSQKLPVNVDLFNDPIFPPTVSVDNFPIVSMNFVADSIASNRQDYFACLGKVLNLVRSGGAFIMSAVVDSNGWSLGQELEPSPNVSEKIITDFLVSNGLVIKNISRSMRYSDLSYSGGWIVLAATKE